MINGEILKNAILSGTNNINLEKSSINDLNIFPVPDGDTGTNMSMTISASVRELLKSSSHDISEVASVTAAAMLRGARGNSGVILSLLFRGFEKGLKGKSEAGGRDLAEALGVGVKDAYGAVMKPTEGTILTVARLAYEHGLKAAESDDDPVKVFSVITEEANNALQTTPDLLPVLKKAGVVDAGGKGLCVIFEGMLSVIRDGIIIEEREPYASNEDDAFKNAAAEFDEDINFTYCTEYIVDKDPGITAGPNELRLFLETIGDSVVLVDDEEIIKVHVHTDLPDEALKMGLTFGSLLTVKIENMREQHKKAAEDNEQARVKKEKEDLRFKQPEEEIGLVAVAAGEGLKDVFKDVGCTHIVSGGQSMNPSTEDICEAILATPAKTVFVLPNNKNIILAAEQTIDMVKDREVVIVPTKTIPQGLSAMLVYDESVSVENNKLAMMSSMETVSTGHVTFAARDSEFGGRKIKEGEIIALEDGKLTICEKSASKAVYKLAKNMVKSNTSFLTIIYGKDVSSDEAEAAKNHIREKLGSHVDISLIDGGQPVYYYILGVE